jgi:hypothetical protein
VRNIAARLSIFLLTCSCIKALHPVSIHACVTRALRRCPSNCYSVISAVRGFCLGALRLTRLRSGVAAGTSEGGDGGCCKRASAAFPASCSVDSICQRNTAIMPISRGLNSAERCSAGHPALPVCHFPCKRCLHSASQLAVGDAQLLPCRPAVDTSAACCVMRCAVSCTRPWS